MLSGKVESAPAGVHGFDCNVRLSAGAVAKFKQAGFAFVVRYVGRKTTPGSDDLDANEAERILDGGLALMAVQHVAGEPWDPTAAKGTDYGKNAVSHAQAIGLPPGINVFLDLEGVASSVAPDVIKTYCNAWFKEVRDAGYEPGIYVGANAGLTGDQLYWELKTQYYWKSGSTVPDIPERGYCMIQRIQHGDAIGGIGIDRNLTVKDKFNHTPLWLIRSTPEEGDVPEDLPADVLAAAQDHGGDPLAVNTQLPLPAPGLTHHYTSDNLFGTHLTIDALLEIGRVWEARHPGCQISIGDISKKGGGPLNGHASHQRGVDLDMRMMKADANSAALTYHDAAYSRTVTQELVDLFYGNGVLAVKLVFFNDAAVVGVQHWPNHDNHLHVRFYEPGTTSAYPLLQRNSKGAAVRELQRRLGFWNAHNPNHFQPPAIDGDFGQGTFDALTAFQRAANLNPDGRAGGDTWSALPKG